MSLHSGACALPTAISTLGVLPSVNLLTSEWHITTVSARLPCDSLVTAFLPPESQGRSNHQSLPHVRSSCSLLYLIY